MSENKQTNKLTNKQKIYLQNNLSVRAHCWHTASSPLSVAAHLLATFSVLLLSKCVSWAAAPLQHVQLELLPIPAWINPDCDQWRYDKHQNHNPKNNPYLSSLVPGHFGAVHRILGRVTGEVGGGLVSSGAHADAHLAGGIQAKVQCPAEVVLLAGHCSAEEIEQKEWDEKVQL